MQGNDTIIFRYLCCFAPKYVIYYEYQLENTQKALILYFDVEFIIIDKSLPWLFDMFVMRMNIYSYSNTWWLFVDCIEYNRVLPAPKIAHCGNISQILVDSKNSSEVIIVLWYSCNWGRILASMCGNGAWQENILQPFYKYKNSIQSEFFFIAAWNERN